MNKLVLLLIYCLILIIYPFKSVVPKTHNININPILKAIYKLKPQIDNKTATIIATSIEYCSLDKNINWRDLVSIAYVESNFEPKIIRRVNGREVDYGIFEINQINIKQYKLNKNKLQEVVYNTKTACTIINDIRKKRSNWIGYYNTGAFSHNKSARIKYELKVAKALEKLI